MYWVYDSILIQQSGLAAFVLNYEAKYQMIQMQGKADSSQYREQNILTVQLASGRPGLYYCIILSPVLV